MSTSSLGKVQVRVRCSESIAQTGREKHSPLRLDTGLGELLSNLGGVEARLAARKSVLLMVLLDIHSSIGDITARTSTS